MSEKAATPVGNASTEDPEKAIFPEAEVMPSESVRRQ
jgi:hypothetical protein